MTAIFITATGADVGTTLVVAALVRHLRQVGRPVDAIKPVATGYDPAQAAMSETGTLVSALGLPFTPESIERLSPWRLRAALPPDLAARQEGRSINVDEVVAYCRAEIQKRRGVLLIDGAGGVMAPLDDRRTMLDVMMALRLPLILVTGSDPGAISHTLTTLELAVPARHERARHHRQRDTRKQCCARRCRRQHWPLRRAGDRATAAPRLGRQAMRLGEKPQLQRGFQRAFQIKQRVQQKRQQQRPAAPTHPAEKQSDNENLQ